MIRCDLRPINMREVNVLPSAVVAIICDIVMMAGEHSPPLQSLHPIAAGMRTRYEALQHLMCVHLNTALAIGGSKSARNGMDSRRRSPSQALWILVP
jgi:hypothetical protein